MFRTILLIAVAFIGPSAMVSAAVLPLKPAGSGRFLADQTGQPFLVVGDTAWSLIVQLGEDAIDRYLEDRAKRGFNSVIVNLIEHRFCTAPPRTRAGLAPFRTAGDFSAPDPDYFAFAHRVVQKAHDRGLVVWLFPAYLGYGGGDQGFFREMKAGGPAKLRAYGRFVGERFQDLPNIVWVLGGDFTPGQADQWTVTEVADGILETDPTHPMTGHGSPSSATALAAFGDRRWLTLDAVYSYEPELFRPLLAAYRRRPTRPFVLMESIYEGEHASRPEQIRRQAYWAMLSGSSGQFFGNNPIWHFDGPGLYPAKVTWEEALGGPGSRDMARLRQLFAGLLWHRLAPEEDHSLVTDGYGRGEATALTAWTVDGRLSVTYVPSTGTGPRELTVRLDQFTGPVTARWYNPTDGRYAAIPGMPRANRGAHVFRTPGDNGTKTNDWLLILEVR
jgi:hypothetical protein